MILKTCWRQVFGRYQTSQLLRKRHTKADTFNDSYGFKNHANDRNEERIVSQDLLHAAGQTKVPKKCRERKINDESYEVRGEILFGISPITMALDAQRRTFYGIFVHKYAEKMNNQRILEVERRAKSLGIRSMRVSVSTLDKLSEGRPHQGVCLDSDELKLKSFGEHSLCEKDDRKQLWVLLDKVQDPMNLGAILRSSYYFGVDRILVTQSSCRLTPVVSKASSGAMEVLTIYQVNDGEQLLNSKLCAGWSVLGSASRDAVSQSQFIETRLVDLRDVVWPNYTILLVGSEGSGISENLLQLCQKFVYIASPIDIHPSLQSLNVSVATGIILQNYNMQRR